jgi:CRISPR-associated endonuclease/helicase Cas3
MANQRRGLYAWPALSGAAFVFDEIHAYDDRLFGKLLRFIGDLKGLPILLMTASLPESRLRELQQVVKRNRRCDLVQIEGPPELEGLNRYHREHCSGDADILARVQKELSRKDRPGRVLWVCNTVNRAITFAEQCEADGMSPLIYHSRFQYRDRVEQHKAVIDRFRNDDEPALAICTQVAEMSLDLSATLLVTDRASIPALIQRLGRLNRRATDESCPSMPFIVIEPVNSKGTSSPAPYSQDVFAESEEWLSKLPAAISQRDLVDCWEELPERECRERDRRTSSWIDGGPCREVTQIREMTPGISVLLEDDAVQIRAGEGRLGELAIPMPSPRNPDWPHWREWDECFGVTVVPNGLIDYDAQRGEGSRLNTKRARGSNIRTAGRN